MALKEKLEVPDLIVCPKGHPLPKNHAQECPICGSMFVARAAVKVSKKE